MRSAGCEVWWAPAGAAIPDHQRFLDTDQRARVGRLLRPADRDRVATAAVLARLVVARRLRCDPLEVRFERVCARCGSAGGHGKPRVVGDDGPEFSVSHSGAWVVVAVADTQVGVDVEAADAGVSWPEMAPQVLSPTEAEAVRIGPGSIGPGSLGGGPAELLRCWTRKEAVLKATGDGLAEPMTALTLAPPGHPAALLHWDGRPDAAARIRLVDLAGRPGHPASLALLDGWSTTIRELDASPLFEEAASAPGRHTPWPP